MSIQGEKVLFPELTLGDHSPSSPDISLLPTGISAMISLAQVLTILLCVLFFFPPPSNATNAKIEVIHSQDRYPAGGSYPILFKITIADSLYIHGSQERGKDLIPTVLSFSTSSEIKIKDIRFPAPNKKKFDYADEVVETFSGEILVRATLEVSEKTPPGNLAIEGLLSYQTCAPKYCMPPEEVPVPLILLIAAPGEPVHHWNAGMFNKPKDGPSTYCGKFPGWGLEANFWLVMLGIFLGGIALNLTPCIYPLIPITVSYFGGMSSRIRGRTIIHGLLYVSGLSITNSILGLTASLTGSVMGRILQEPVILILVSGFLFFLALSFFDLWEFQLPSGLTRLASKNFGGYFGTFFMGLTLGIVAAPCLGPFMLGLLTYVAQMADPVLGFLYFFVLSLGMGLPLAVLAVFSGALKKLPLSGGWLMWIRKGLGWVLLGMSVYILQPLISEPSGKTTGIAIIITLAGVHLGWLDRSQATLPFFTYFKKGVGTFLICLAVAIFLFVSLGPEGRGINWASYDPALVSEATKKNRPVILDFYAAWCAPCRKLEDKVFTDPEIVDLSQFFLTIRIDMTKGHPNQDEFQRLYQIKGFPTIIFINRNGVVEKDLSIESFVNPEVVIDRMKRLIEQS